MSENRGDALSRREFGKAVAAAGVGLAIPASGVFAAGSDTVRVAVVGCGERGTVDAVYCLKSAPGVELVAIADLFQDKVDAALEKLRKEVPSQVKVAPERIFLGFDAYKKVLALDDVNLVMLLTPPGFRPEMVAAGVEAGKHMFVEKPGAVDPVGLRMLIEASGRAAQKGLSIVVGTQQRYAPQYLELIQRIRDGSCEDARPSNPLEDSHSPLAPLLPDPEESLADTSLDQLIAEYVRSRTGKGRG